MVSTTNNTGLNPGVPSSNSFQSQTVSIDPVTGQTYPQLPNALVVTSNPATGFLMAGGAVVGAGGGGVTAFALLTDKTTVDIPGTNTPTANALALKANAASPVLTGIVTHAGADIVPSTPVASFVVDFTIGENSLTLTSAPTLTFGGSPATGQRTTLVLTGDTVARVVTLPSNVRSASQQSVVPSFNVPINWTGTIFLKKSIAGYDMIGEPVALAAKGWSGAFAVGGNDTQYVTNSSPLAGNISLFTTQNGSGTATYQLQINGVSVTGGSNAVSTTKVNSVPTALFTVAVGDEITIVRTIDATCVNARWAVRVAPATA